MTAIKDIKLAYVRRYIGDRRRLYELDELDDIKLHPQTYQEGYAMKAEASIIIANLNDLCILVSLALEDDGLVYTGYSIHHSSGGCLGGPSKESKVKPGRTVRMALRNELEDLRQYSQYYGKRINHIITKAIHRINIRSLRQSTIFDILG